MGDSNVPDFSKPSLDSSPVPEVDRTYGYLGLKLETPLARLPGMEFIEQRGELAIYRRPADSLQVGRARVAYIEYWFQQDTLRDIAIGFDNLAVGTQLRDAFSKVYGRGLGTDRLVSWRGKHAQILYTVNDGDQGYLLISTLRDVPQPGEALLGINAIAGQGPEAVAAVLGQPDRWETVRLSGIPYRKAFYRGGFCEVVYIADVADWITVYSQLAVPADATALKLLGLSPVEPHFQHNGKLTWRNIANLRSVDFEFSVAGRVEQVFVKYQTW